MTINIRTKGADGEREACKLLNGIIVEVMTAMGCPAEQIEAAVQMVQRNQNQSAVGGCDLTNTFGISFEIKRQEALSVNSWWTQCKTAAEKNNELPVLMYRQNRKPWKFRTYAWLALPGSEPGMWNRQQMIVSEFDLDTFKVWFARWVQGKIESGFEVRV